MNTVTASKYTDINGSGTRLPHHVRHFPEKDDVRRYLYCSIGRDINLWKELHAVGVRD